MGISVYSLLWVMQDFDHQPSSSFEGFMRLLSMKQRGYVSELRASTYLTFPCCCHYIVVVQDTLKPYANHSVPCRSEDSSSASNRHSAESRCESLAVRVEGSGLGAATFVGN